MFCIGMHFLARLITIYEIVILIAYASSHYSVIHEQLSIGARSLNFDIGLHLCPYCVYLNNISSKQSKAGHYRPTSETPIKWRFAGGPFMARH